MQLDRNRFWRDACAIQGSVTPLVLSTVVSMGLLATAICAVSWLGEELWQLRLGLEVAPYEIAGAALGLLLILRTNAGYDRWWEARRLCGGIVNQSRNLVINALAYGPPRTAWQETFTRWAAIFPHVARCSLRGELPSEEVQRLLGPEAVSRIAQANHMPAYVALQLATQLRAARDAGELDDFAFLQIDKERATLIDHIGACERILKTPLPLVYSIKIRRFIAIFLLTLPFALLHRTNADWLIPPITMLVAYPLLSLDQIGIELQNPFVKANLSHLPLGDISLNIETNLLALLHAWEAQGADPAGHTVAAGEAKRPG